MGGYQSDSSGGSSNGWRTIGRLDATANPAFPAGKQNDVYIILSSGTLGGAYSVDELDMIYCNQDNNGGSFADIASAWIVIPHKFPQP